MSTSPIAEAVRKVGKSRIPVRVLRQVIIRQANEAQNHGFLVRLYHAIAERRLDRHEQRIAALERALNG